MRRYLVGAVSPLMSKLPFYPIEAWLLLGAFFIAVELLYLPNIGLLFLGLGALSCGILISTLPYIIHYQWIIFGLASLFWFVALWIPLKRYVYKQNIKIAYSDMINNEVYVCNRPLIAGGGIGEVKWSGTIMNARLEDNEPTEAAIGEKLYIKEACGNILICSKKMIGK
jgi:membrane protein implicated in regulation of membrane protease activity